MAIDIKKYEEQLKKALAEIGGEIKKIPDAEEMGSDSEGELMEEEADEAEEDHKNAGEKEAFKSRRADIELALAKIKKGTYGVCEKCGKAIGEDVLKVVPESRWCKACKKGMK